MTRPVLVRSPYASNDDARWNRLAAPEWRHGDAIHYDQMNQDIEAVSNRLFSGLGQALQCSFTTSRTPATARDIEDQRFVVAISELVDITQLGNIRSCYNRLVHF